MFDCEITVKGDGIGKYGRFKHDKTGPVRQFMVDNVHLYSKVKAHVLDCDKCDCEEALRHYLKRRKTESKFRGLVTGTLAKMALSYERKSKTPISPNLVNEFIWRSTDLELISKFQDRLTVRDLVNSYKISIEFYGGPRYIHKSWFNSNTKMGTIFKIVSENPLPEDDQELEKLIAIAEVMIA
jgi:hypothetical protein